MFLHWWRAILLSAQLNENNENSIIKFQQFYEGVSKYQKHLINWKPNANEIWKHNQSTLLETAAINPECFVFFIPPLMNRGNIFFLPKNNSFINFLLKNNISSYVLDWGDIDISEYEYSIEDYFINKILPSLKTIFMKNNCSGFILGYCMGGLLSLALAKVLQTLNENCPIKGVILLASPWDFHAYSKHQRDFVKTVLNNLDPMLKNLPYFHSDIILFFLHGLAPNETFEKFSRFNKEENLEKIENFILTEDWINNVNHLSKSVAKVCFNDWLNENSTLTRNWNVLNNKINPNEINIPILLATPERDTVIPFSSNNDLEISLPSCVRLKPDTGHLGTLIGRKAKTEFWEPCVNWMSKRV